MIKVLSICFHFEKELVESEALILLPPAYSIKAVNGESDRKSGWASQASLS
jgi:hypothetical protein